MNKIKNCFIVSRAATHLASQGIGSATAAQVADYSFADRSQISARYCMLAARRAEHCSSRSVLQFHFAVRSLGLYARSPNCVWVPLLRIQNLLSDNLIPFDIDTKLKKPQVLYMEKEPKAIPMCSHWLRAVKEKRSAGEKSSALHGKRRARASEHVKANDLQSRSSHLGSGGGANSLRSKGRSSPTDIGLI